MKSTFKYGLSRGLFYYAIGFISTLLTYIIFGWDYRHAPGLHHIVAFLFLLGGAGWTLYYIVMLVIGRKSIVNYGTLTVHLAAIFSVVLYVYADIRSARVANYKTDPADILTINRDTTNNTASVIDGNGDTLYLQTNDSVIIDKTQNDTNNHR